MRYPPRASITRFLSWAFAEQNFVAMGYTADKDQLTNSDLTVCARPPSRSNSTTSNAAAANNRPLLQHYLMEKIEYGPKASGMVDGGGNVSGSTRSHNLAKHHSVLDNHTPVSCHVLT
jgi:hypothetical protein